MQLATMVWHLLLDILVFFCFLFILRVYVNLCEIWYHLCNIKNVKNTIGGVLLLVLEITLLHWCFLRFLNCTDYTKSHNTSHINFQQQTNTYNIFISSESQIFHGLNSRSFLQFDVIFSNPMYILQNTSKQSCLRLPDFESNSFSEMSLKIIIANSSWLIVAKKNKNN